MDETQAAKGLGPNLIERLQQRLQAQQLQMPDAPVYCEIAPAESYTFDPSSNYAIWWRLHTVEAGQRTVPPCAVGLQWFDESCYGEALAHVQLVARERLGWSVTAIEQAIVMNPDWERRKRAEHLAPDVRKRFPKLARPLDELTVVEWNADAVQRCKWYLKHGLEEMRLGHGIGIRCGVTGSGKTTLLASLSLELVEKYGIHAHYVQVPDLVGMDFGKGMSSAIEAAKDTDFLLLDEVDGAVRGSKEGDEDASPSRRTLLSILDWRYRMGLPTAWTSNTASAQKLRDNLGERITRRLTHEYHQLFFGPAATSWQRLKKGGRK